VAPESQTGHASATPTAKISLFAANPATVNAWLTLPVTAIVGAFPKRGKPTLRPCASTARVAGAEASRTGVSAARAKDGSH
jgi:hypothetical protein